MAKQSDKQRSLLGSEFLQFLGGTVSKMTAKGGPFEGRPQAAAHETIAVVAEELLKRTYDQDGDTDFFRAKPLIRAAIFLVGQYKEDIEGADIDVDIKEKILGKCNDAKRLLSIMTNVEEDKA